MTGIESAAAFLLVVVMAVGLVLSISLWLHREEPVDDATRPDDWDPRYRSWW